MFKILFFMSAVLVAAALANAETKVGFVDVTKAIQGTSAGKKAKTEMETQFNKKKKELEKKEADLKKLGEDLEKKKSVLSAEALKTKQGELQNEIMKFREELASSQSEIQKKNQELTAPIIEKLQKVIAQVSKEKEYSLVLQDTQTILFAKPEHDLTEDVIKAFEKEK
ncbi:OmpH family outer membrane protein [Bdellovibrio sp. HCB-110]|uniref:OmpH family outer membrane protein n=1 Tax=Bdellovibrio sp. HCB-110 TaxID=3391182 RepID=UPI0039B4EAD7